MDEAAAARHRLKRETNDLHRRAEASFDRVEWLASPLSYGMMMERWVGLLAVLEQGLAPFFSGADLAGPITGRLRRLAADLDHLGRPAARERASPEPPPVFADRAEALGALYVLEGSTLGGRIIAGRVHDRLGTAMPTAFLDGDGSRAGQSWLAFLDRLDRALDTPAALDSAVAGARRTFLIVERWLGDPPPSRFDRRRTSLDPNPARPG